MRYRDDTPTEPETDGDLAIWDSYYNQPNPLVVYRAGKGDEDGQWVNLNVSDLPDLLKQKLDMPLAALPMPGIN